MTNLNTMDRRGFLRTSAGTSAALLAAPTAFGWLANPQKASAATAPAFVDAYTTNTMADLTPSGNAAVRILGGMSQVWQTGKAWNTGTPLMPDLLRANLRYCARVTAERTDAQAREAFLIDRQHQSYSVIAGLGPLAELYRSGAKAVTGITEAPDGTPAGTVSDTLPAGAPPGSALGAGSVDSELGQVVRLVNAVRGPSASGNPGKYAYQYPRPWRMTEDSAVVETGATDGFGFPVYRSEVIVAPQLLRQRNLSPTDDGGYPSGHTNALHLAALALAYAVPERFQELVTRAFESSHTRIVSGMHSPVDVIGGRVLATALAAAALADPANAALKTAARAQAAAWFQARTGCTADTLYAYAHSAAPDRDPYADREANGEAVRSRLTYVLPRRGRAVPMTVPKGAEVLLETRLPYLDAAQRREVLRTTALPSGYVLLDGPESWGRLNLFAAADGYGAFDSDVSVQLDAGKGGFAAADSWRNDIDGPGGLTKLGTGSLTLTGTNRYTGATVVREGLLTAASRDALGRGDMQLRGGTLRLDQARGSVRVRGDYLQAAGGTLSVTLRQDRDPALRVAGRAVLETGSTLVLRLGGWAPERDEWTVPVLESRSLRGEFAAVVVEAEGYRATPLHTHHGLAVRLTRC
ncbi:MULTISPECIES: phosphatase PAP2 family protein [unclassified Kitasatospora]|uniref:phosphatase PAP2 family protein n=1 Tax=unclassified Kitasatospora TaxID=2633591 RepID=UPI000710B569|nr:MULTISPECIES: phosphatase PAP2 family protein [unclassified Kitasatospora]KQV13224.1 phosphoesterase [Kitasatospora sp. Root107]KRB75327.1 phosphoesterase [Kitasatospora sp. Root187]